MKNTPSARQPSLPGTPVMTVELRSQELFRDRREILIEHANEIYRLRLTSNNKLILTK